MNIFGCSDKDLAKVFAENPKLYNDLKTTLGDLKKRNLLKPVIEQGLDKTFSQIERANSLARQSDYYIFEVEDSWAEEQFGNGFGYSIFQKINDQMTRRLGIIEAPPEFHQVIKFLRRKNVKRVFTTNIPLEGYFGISYEERSGEDNKDVILYKCVNERYVDSFKKEGIELIVLR